MNVQSRYYVLWNFFFETTLKLYQKWCLHGNVRGEAFGGMVLKEGWSFIRGFTATRMS